MTTMELGLTSDTAASGEAFEDEIFYFFFYLFQSADACAAFLHRQPDGFAVRALLRTDWRRADPKIVPHCLQIDYGEELNAQYLSDFDQRLFDVLPLLNFSEPPKDEENFCYASSLIQQLQPPTVPPAHGAANGAKGNQGVGQGPTTETQLATAEPQAASGVEGETSEAVEDAEPTKAKDPSASSTRGARNRSSKSESESKSESKSKGVEGEAALKDFLANPDRGSSRDRLFAAFPGLKAMVQCQSHVSIWRNAPRASFADLIVINRGTRELWLVQCKSSVATPRFDARGELLKMGMPTSDPVEKTRWDLALQFREALQLVLGAITVRYILCIGCPVSASIRQSLVNSMSSLASLPSHIHVHVMCSAFGFNFLPVDELCVSERTEAAVMAIDKESRDLIRDIPKFCGKSVAEFISS
jgi:hypothetical protein